MKPVKEGKVREIYDNGDSLIMVATDRISCFDVILHNTVTKKGTVLTQMSKFWFDYTKDILPNHMIMSAGMVCVVLELVTSIPARRLAERIFSFLPF